MKAATPCSNALSACFVATIALAGCGQMKSRDIEGRPVSLAEFAGPRPAAPVQTELATEPPRSRDAPTEAPRLRAGAGPEDDLATPEPMRLTELGDHTIVDSLVGEVNGRPIFADEFLEPIEDRLIQAAEQYAGAQREAAFRMIIHGWLQDVIIDELILAEAEAALTPNEQMGLLAFIRNWQEQLIRQKGGGTRAAAEDRLRRETGMGLEGTLDTRKKMVLINELRRKKIDPRVIVSWRDIQREYQRRFDEFNPPATVTLARIRLSTERQADLIEEVKPRLAAGEPFARVAEDAGFPDGGRWETFEVGPGGISDIGISDDMKGALEGLGAGQTSEPFIQGAATVWLHVESVEHSAGKSIYDAQVQRALSQELRARRNVEEWNRHIESLLEKGIYHELDEMAERLYRIALDRYAR